MRARQPALTAVAALGLALAGAPAAADAVTRDLAAGYTRELAACQTRASGITKIATGAQALVDAGQAELAADLAALRAGLAEVTAYCDELTATLALIADPNASYRALERKLDDQDNKIRKLRASTKAVLEQLAPVTQRVIPLINARVGAAAPAAKRIKITFPSGRTIEIPALTGALRTAGGEALDQLDYLEGKAAATVSARRLPATTCAREREAITAAGVTDVPATDATRPLALAWYVSYGRAGRRLRAACRPAKDGVVVATIDEPTAITGWPELEPALRALLALP